MALSFDQFTDANNRKGPVCTVALIFGRLSDKDADVLRAALDDGELTHAAIARVLKAEGHKIDGSTVGRHRKRECACEG